ncbi:MAG: hypothetical protein K2N61_06495 [Lachnospiraceae bacterium]|nr:hypothetical protein [Lachnospiraceae bacterium]
MFKVKRFMFVILATIVFMICGKTNVAHASSVTKDTEPNNSYDEAQFLSLNLMTYSHRVSENYRAYNYAQGTLSGDDEDWYYIYLFSIDEVYLTISGGTGAMYFDIIDDSTKEVIQTVTYLNASEHVFRVNMERGKYYYIRVYHNNFTDINSDYKFSIGRPEYLLGLYTHKFGTGILPAGGEWEKGVNLVEMNVVPKGSIGYKITISGCTSSASDSRYFWNKPSGWITTKTGFYYELPVIDDSKLDQEWKIKYQSSSKKNVSFFPQFTMLYVYPRLPLSEQ